MTFFFCKTFFNERAETYPCSDAQGDADNEPYRFYEGKPMTTNSMAIKSSETEETSRFPNV